MSPLLIVANWIIVASFSDELCYLNLDDPLCPKFEKNPPDVSHFDLKSVQLPITDHLRNSRQLHSGYQNKN